MKQHSYLNLASELWQMWDFCGILCRGRVPVPSPAFCHILLNFTRTWSTQGMRTPLIPSMISGWPIATLNTCTSGRVALEDKRCFWWEMWTTRVNFHWFHFIVAIIWSQSPDTPPTPCQVTAIEISVLWFFVTQWKICLWNRLSKIPPFSSDTIRDYDPFLLNS